jgi:hypothetical protein
MQAEPPTNRDLLEARYPEIKFEDSLVGSDVLEDALFRRAIDADVHQFAARP